jgi:DNA-directed RNA polymerase specialized sigma subunit
VGAAGKAIPANSIAGIPPRIWRIPRAKRKAPEARTKLAAFAADYFEREQVLERVAEQLRADRDQAIRVAYRDGLPMADIAALLNMSHQRVSQIVRS